MASTYTKILSKGIEANLPEEIGVDKLRFTTDTGRLFLDDNGTSRIEITDFVKGKTKEQILGTLAPLPKFYLTSDTNELYFYNNGEWKSIYCTESLNASTASYAVEAGHSVNADTATNASTADYASTASYTTNASTSSYSSDAIEGITRNGVDFTVTRKDGSTFTFDQQDNNTTYDIATTASSGLIPVLDGSTAKYLRADGTWETPPINDNTTYTNGDGISLDGNVFSNAGVREITLHENNLNVNTNGTTVDITIPFATNASTAAYSTNAGTATSADKDGNGNVISTTYAPKTSPAFEGSPTTPDVTSGDSSGKIANTKFVGTAITNAIAGITQFDYQIVTELPASGVKGTIYLIALTTSETGNIYEEYIWLGSDYEKIGTTEIDLTGYVNTVDVSGAGNAITGVSQDGSTVTFTKGSTFLTEHPAVVHNSSTASATPSAGSTFDFITNITTDDYGHASSFVKTTITFPDSVSTATNASTADHAKDAISTIERSGETFTVTRFDGSTFTFDQKDDNTTYSVATTESIGLMPVLDGSTAKYLRADGSWETPANDNTTYEFINNASTLDWENTSTIGTVGGVDLTITMPENPNTDTTYAIASTASSGLLPSLDGSTAKYLRADGGWVVPPNDNTTYEFTNNSSTLDWNNTSTIGTVGGVDLVVTMPSNPNTDTTYSIATTESAGLLPALDSDNTKYLRADGTWETPANDNTTYTNGSGLSLSGNEFSIDTSASTVAYSDKADKDASGNVITSTYAPLSSPIFTGTPTAPNVTAGDSSTKIANTNFVTDAITTAVAGITQFDYEVVTTLPATGVKGKIYLKAITSTETDNIYEEFIWIGSDYEKLGTTAMDLSNYVNTVDITGDGNAVTGYTKDGSTITLTKGSTFLTSVPSEYATTATYTGGTGITKTGTEFSLDTSGASSGTYGPSTNVTGSNGTTLAVPNITVDQYGRITSITNKSYTSVDNNTTYDVATTASAGLVPALDGSTVKYLRADGTWVEPIGLSYKAGTGLSLNSSTFSIDTNASTCTAAKYPVTEADFDFGELTSTSETYSV